MFCTQCGTPLTDDVRFCPKCGVPAQAAGSTSAAPEREEIVFTRKKITLEYIHKWSNHEATGTLTVTIQRIHFSADTVTARVGVLGINDEFSQSVSDMSIPFSEIAGITRKRSIMDMFAYKFDIDCGEASVAIRMFKGAEEFQKVLEQQWKKPINTEAKVSIV